MPEEIERVRARADLVLSGRVTLFGYPEVSVPADAVDPTPTPGVRWPDRHAKRMNYRLGSLDPKWTWEVNRCQQTALLVAAWLLTREDRYGRAAARRLVHWVETHPPGRGIAWSNGFEAGVRGISLALVLDALRGSGFLEPSEEQLVLRALWQHARWIQRDPSLGSSANNHRIGELVGLAVMGSLAPEVRGSGSWVDTAVAELEREMSIQILDDGASAEQAFAYHVFVIDLLLVAVAVLEQVGHVPPPEVVAALARSGDALWAQLDRDEPAPTYGDTDDGRAIRLDAEDLRDPRGAAAGIAAFRPHARAAFVAHGMDMQSWWLFGRAGSRRLAEVRGAAEPGTIALPDAGYTLFRGMGRRAILDHGPLGLGPLAAHGHADALGLQVSLGAHELVVDPGVGSYFARPELRRAFRGTGFHATVLVDDTDSSEQSGPFLWTQHAEARVLRTDLDSGIVVAEHTGYLRLPDPVVHRRLVSAPSDSPHVLVVDRLEARAAHRYSQRWPLHPELEIVEHDARRIVALGPSHGVVIAAACRSARLEVVRSRGLEEPVAGWWSPRLELCVPSWLVAVDVEAVGSIELVTAIVPFVGTVAPDVEFDVDVAESRSVVRLAVAGSTHLLELDLESPETVTVSGTPAGVA